MDGVDKSPGYFGIIITHGVLVMSRSRLLSATARLGLGAGFGMGLALMGANGAQAALVAAPGSDAAQTRLAAEIKALKAFILAGTNPVAAPAAGVAPIAFRVPSKGSALVAGGAAESETLHRVQAPQDDAARAQQDAEATPIEMPSNNVLTPVGKVIVEPSIEYQHTDVNRFVTGGVAILDTVLVGVFEAKQADRSSVTAAVSARTGLFDRFELEAKIPYTYRDDRSTTTIVNSNNTVATTSLTDHGLGDIEVAGHYQLNSGRESWPIFVGNMRLKAPTGTDPYEVERNAAGIEQELATGSGFWGVEPSLSMMLPSDPAVIFANIGYMWNVPRDIDKTIGTRRIDRVDPGDSVRFGFGLGFALNEELSLSLGYSHDFILATETQFSDSTFESEELSVGSINFGINYRVSDTMSVNTSVVAGVTEDSPDVRLMIRTPIALDLF